MKTDRNMAEIAREAGVSEQNNNNIIIKGSDEGIGIPQEEQYRLFEPFHCASNVGNVCYAFYL